MQKSTYLILIALFSGLLISCKKNFNDNMFNDSKLTEYKLDDYEGTVDFRLSDEYDIPDSLIHIFPIWSKTKDQTDSTKIWAIYIGNLKQVGGDAKIEVGDSVIVYFHGNRDHMDFYWQRAKLLAHTGGKNNYGVLMIDYRGYGLSEGESTEETFYADASAAIAWIKKAGGRSQKYGVYGFSLGSAAATYVTYNQPNEFKPLFIALEAPFASLATLVNDGAGLNLDPLFFSTYKFDNKQKIKFIQTPFYWIHGTEDKYIPMETNGEVLYNAYTGTISKAERIVGAGHSDVPQSFGFKRYTQSLETFIRKGK